MGAEEHLIICLHGIGASGTQLMPLANSWRSSMPNTRFATPDAPMHHWRGRQWFSTEGNPLDQACIQTAREAFDALIKKIVDVQGFSNAHDRVAFVGVSQGAIVALDAVASGRWKVGALVSFAGLLPPQQISAAYRQTSILLVHGQDDATIPAAASTLAAAQLQAAGFSVELSVEPGVGHTVSASGAGRALAFLKRTLEK
ncbi:dienelactone hydrolase family protein [Rhizobium cauense]|uniref:alpha/beta hydrolase n=1 Tax=Rhizobium cauense TaxID=1166683 RepID=UPI001C6EAF5A|nr:dienelactone hydrolase family protein [Rhizobium cauense]MBW9117377.1 dienelactone hydrolase family protein [Rhizobium cauense]